MGKRTMRAHSSSSSDDENSSTKRRGRSKSASQIREVEDESQDEEIKEIVTALLDAEEIEPKSRSRSRSRSKGKNRGKVTRMQSDGYDTGEVTEDDESSTSPHQKQRKSNLKKDFSTPKKKLKWDKSVQENIHFEFGGTPGAVGIIFGLPLVIYLLYFSCNRNMCFLQKNSPFSFPGVFSQIVETQFFTWRATYIYFSWLALNIILERVLPGEIVEGALLPNGKDRLKYTLSGHLQFWVCLVAMVHAIPHFTLTKYDDVYVFKGASPLHLSVIYDEYIGLISISCLFCLIFSVYLYFSSFKPGKILARGGDTGYKIYDFFIGRELNPRIGTLDLKEFCELRPGLIGWLVIDIGMCMKQYSNTGSITMSMLLVTLYQGFYVWDALYQERAILTTMDITTDGFGYMLAFGDLAWVPFIYSLQCRYLVDYDPKLTVHQLLLISSVQFAGWYIFRASNSEKDAFRRNPEDESVAHLSYLETKRGTKLITSGWWGAARKINYTGDWLITLSWCMLCGFNSPVPYFQAIYFLILLVHRAIRDDQMCAEKYGDDWIEYKRQVPFMFIPNVI